MNIFKLLKDAKFDYDQIKEENVIRNSKFHIFFVSDHLKVDDCSHFFKEIKIVNILRCLVTKGLLKLEIRRCHL